MSSSKIEAVTDVSLASDQGNCGYWPVLEGIASHFSSVMSLVLLGLELACAAYFLYILFRPHAGWVRFAQRRKLGSRIVLCMLAYISLIPVAEVSRAVQRTVPFHLSPEFPSVIQQAIKLGMYGLYVEHEVASQLSPDKEVLVRCVRAWSLEGLRQRQDKCGEDRACLEAIPVTTREQIIAGIKESQVKAIEDVSKVCKDVDVSKL